MRTTITKCDVCDSIIRDESVTSRTYTYRRGAVPVEISTRFRTADGKSHADICRFCSISLTKDAIREWEVVLS